MILKNILKPDMSDPIIPDQFKTKKTDKTKPKNRSCQIITNHYLNMFETP